MSYPDYDTPRLRGVLAEIHAERQRQDAKWGQQNHPDGTGDAAMFGASMASIAQMLKGINDSTRTGTYSLWVPEATTPQWLPIFLEEVFEAAAETDPAKLRAELVQVAAVAVAWIEAIDRRSPHPDPVRNAGRRAIQQHTCFTVHCDECKNAPENDEGIPHFGTAADAENDAEACGWVKLPDGRLICEDCIPELVERGEIERDGAFGEYQIVAAVEGGEQQ